MSDLEGAMKFVNNDGVEVGRLFVNDDGDLTFRGRATETAEIFIDEICRIFNNELEFYTPEDVVE